MTVALVAALAFFVVGRSGDESSDDASSATSGTVAGAAEGGNGPETTEVDPDAAAGAAAGTYPCAEVDSSSWKPAETKPDMVGIVRYTPIPDPSGQGFAESPSFVDFATPDDFLAQATVADSAARRQIMEAGGYSDGVKAEYGTDQPFTVQVLAFRDANAVKDFMTARFADLCTMAGSDELTPLGDDGFAFVDGVGAVHGDFILGGYQISLVLCSCTPEADASDMVEWYDAWMDHFAS